MKSSRVFMIVLALAVIFLLVGIYYLVPGVPHLFVHHPKESHSTPAIIAIVIAVVLGVVGFVVRPKKA